MRRVLINQADITQISMDSIDSASVSRGQAKVQLKRFALTANNVTYAAAADMIGYWKFFPSGAEGQGLLPVWGFADVVESRSDALDVGARLYGFFPLSEELVIDPQPLGKTGILDAAAHRANLPEIYNQYALVKAGDADHERLRALLQPLLATSYVLSDWLVDNDHFGADQIIIGSASSKTGLGLCKFLDALDVRPKNIVGLTSAGNADFVRALGACDQVITYDAIDTLKTRPSVYVDMSGNARVKTELHSHLADVLKHSCAVGTSHWDQFKPRQDLAGPKPEFFFAPSQIVKRRKDWGPGVIEKKIGDAWQGIAAQASSWLDVKPHHGLHAALPVYDALARGQASPRDGHVIELA